MRRELPSVAGREPKLADVNGARLMFVVAFAAGGAQPALAMVGGPLAWTIMLSCCRATVANKGIADPTRFEQEVEKRLANPVTYPPADPKPA